MARRIPADYLEKKKSHNMNNVAAGLRDAAFRYERKAASKRKTGAKFAKGLTLRSRVRFWMS